MTDYAERAKNIMLYGNPDGNPNEQAKPPTQAEPKEPVDYAKRLMERTVTSVNQPTGAISTITGKPETKVVYTGQRSADFGTHYKAGYVDKPEAKIDIYSKARFPNLSREERLERYGIRDGEIVFVGDDGEVYRETQDIPIEKLSRFVGGEAARAPVYALSGAGTALGPLGVGAGAATGELIRKQIGRHVFKEGQNVGDYLVDMGVEGLMGLGGALLGKALSGGVNARRLKSGGPMRYVAKRELENDLLSPEDHVRAKIIDNLAKRHGITLPPHQLYERTGMTNTWKYLQQHPRTADAVQKIEEKIRRTGSKELDKFIKKHNPNGTNGPFAIGRRLSDLSDDVITKMEKGRTRATNPFYKEAFENAQPVDTIEVINEINELMKPLKPKMKVRKELERIKSFLEEDLGKGLKRPETNLEVLDHVKKEIDSFLDGPDAKAVHKDMLFRIGRIKDKLVTKMKDTNPLYKKALEKHQELSPPIDNMKRSIIGHLSNLRTDKTEADAIKRVFNEGKSDWRLIERAATVIRKKDPKLWNDTVFEYLRDTWNGLRPTEGGAVRVNNPLGKMYVQLFGNRERRNIMRAALTKDQYKELKDLMTVFRHAAYGQGKESLTHPLQEVGKELSKGGVLKGTVELVRHPGQKFDSFIMDRWNDVLMHGRQDQILNAMMKKDVVELTRKLKPLRPGSKKLIEGATTLAAMLAGNYGVEEVNRTTTQAYEPAKLEETNTAP